MKIYIAGPMTALPEHNYPAFHRAAKRLRDQGHQAVNPAEIVIDTSTPWVDCMRADLHALLDCDAVFMLHGHEKSKGATLEKHIATALGFKVLYEEQADA